MGRTLRSASSKTTPTKRKQPSSSKRADCNTAFKDGPDSLHRNEKNYVLIDQTNTAMSPAKKAKLRTRKNVSNDTRTIAIDEHKNTTVDTAHSERPVKETSRSAGNSFKVQEITEAFMKDRSSETQSRPRNTGKKKQSNETPNASIHMSTRNMVCNGTILKDDEAGIQLKTRSRRIGSLKENDDELTPVVETAPFAIRKRQRKIDKQDILTLINEVSSDDEDDHVTKKITNEVKSPKTPKFGVKTFYGISNKNSKQASATISPVSSERMANKVCVYKTLKDNPTTVKPQTENDRLALYEFEFDSQEEAKPKKKKKPRPVKSKQPAKVKKVKKVVNNIRAGHHITPSTKLLPHAVPYLTDKLVKPSSSTVNFASRTGSENSKQKTTITRSVQSAASTQEFTETQGSTKSQTSPSHSQVFKFANQSSLLNVPLANLFDDDIDPSIPSTAKSPENTPIKTPVSSPRRSKRITSESPKPAGPIRFEYQDILKVRERLLRNSLTPNTSRVGWNAAAVKVNAPASNKTRSPQQDISFNDTMPAADHSDDSFQSPKLRQTSIRSFLQGKNRIEERIDDTGLFSTGSRSAVPNLPENDEVPNCDLSAHPLLSSTPQRPERVRPPLQMFLSPVMSNHSKGNSPGKTRTSPRKGIGTPEKSRSSPRKKEETPVRVSPRKLAGSPKKDSPVPGPTRLSVGTLRAVFRSNVQAAPLVAPLTKDDTIPIDITDTVPESPPKNFNKPARKSYERRPRKATQFMELEEGEEVHEEVGENGGLFGDLEGDIEEPAIKHRHHKQKKQKGQIEEELLDNWASKFNSQIEEAEKFSLQVE